LGVDKDLSDYPIVVTFQTEPFAFEDKKIYDLSFKHYCNEPSFAPNGKSIITVYIQAQYDWWLKKRINIDNYKSEKNRLSNEVIDRIEKQYPELKGKIEVLDVATPLTFERYCGAFKGSYMSFGDTPNAKPLNSKGVVRGVKNIFLAGQWAMPPGGAPNAALAGKWAVDRVINNQNKKKRKFFNFRFIYP
jgi:phytoene dehydrogenase-like protein